MSQSSLFEAFKDTFLIQHFETSTPIEAWKCNFPAFQEIRTDGPTERPTNRPKNGQTGSWGSFASNNNHISVEGEVKRLKIYGGIVLNKFEEFSNRNKENILPYTKMERSYYASYNSYKGFQTDRRTDVSTLNTIDFIRREA